MLADLLLPFPASHPSTVPSDLIHPPLRNETFFPYPRVLLTLLLVQLIEAALYSLRLDLLSVLLPSPLIVSTFRLPRQSCDSIFYPFSASLSLLSSALFFVSPTLFKLVDFFFSQSRFLHETLMMLRY